MLLTPKLSGYDCYLVYVDPSPFFAEMSMQIDSSIRGSTLTWYLCLDFSGVVL